MRRHQVSWGLIDLIQLRQCFGGKLFAHSDDTKNTALDERSLFLCYFWKGKRVVSQLKRISWPHFMPSTDGLCPDIVHTGRHDSKNPWLAIVYYRSKVCHYRIFTYKTYWDVYIIFGGNRWHNERLSMRFTQLTKLVCRFASRFTAGSALANLRERTLSMRAFIIGMLIASS